MDSLKGKYAIVTGGTRGIGRAIAERLLHDGAAVAICGRTQAAVAQAVAGMQGLGRIFGTAADVSQVEGARGLFAAVDQEFGALDILVNNAGQGRFRKVGEMTPEECHLNIDLNLNGAFYCAHEALARFATRGGGFSEALIVDHRHDNVRVSSIMPGSVDTEYSGTPGKPRPVDTSWMIAPEDVAEAVSMVLRMPVRTMVSRVEIRPSRPA